MAWIKITTLDKVVLIMISIIIILGFFVFFQPEENETAVVTQETTTITDIIDGDTVVIQGGDRVRLLGIDADEKDENCYQEAKEQLKQLILNKEVSLEKDQTDKDQYGRLLRWIFLYDQNINLKMVEDGFAICSFYEPDVKYKEECASLETKAKEQNIGCKWKPECTCENWIDKECGGGNCQISQRLQSRVCNPKGCETENQCIEDVTCKTSIETSSGATTCIWKNLTTEKTGLEVIKAEEAKNYLYEEKIVEGYAYAKKYTNPALFINFDKPYPNHSFTSIVWNTDWYKFPENAADLYNNKTVRVEGLIKEYEGKPEIILYDPSQIEVCQ